MNDARFERYTFLLVGLAIAMSVWLFAQRANYSLNFNESHNLMYAAAQSPLELLRIDDMHPPGFYLFTHFLQRVTGHNDILLRLPSLIFSVFSALLVYVLGKRLYSRKVAVLGMLLFSVSLIQVDASSSVRPYSLLTFMFLVSMIYFIRILEENKNSDHFVNSAAAFAAMFLHYYGGFLPIYQLVFMVCSFGEHKPQMRKWLLFQSAVALVYIPFAYIGLTQQLKLVNPIGGAEILTFPALIKLLYTLTPVSRGLYLVMSPTMVVIALLFVGVFVLGAHPFRKNSLLTIYFALPIIIVAAVSNIAHLKFYQPYHMVFLLPAFVLLTAKGLLKIGKVGLFACGLILILNLTAPMDDPNPDWENCASYLKQHVDQSDVIALCPELNDAILYYWPFAPIIPFNRVIAVQGLPRRVWLVFVYPGHYYDPQFKNVLIQRLQISGFALVSRIENIKNTDVVLLCRE